MQVLIDKISKNVGRSYEDIAFSVIKGVNFGKDWKEFPSESVDIVVEKPQEGKSIELDLDDEVRSQARDGRPDSKP